MLTPKMKKLGIVLGVLVVLIVAAMIIVPKLLDLNRYNSLITKQVEKALGGKSSPGPHFLGNRQGSAHRSGWIFHFERVRFPVRPRIIPNLR